MTGEAVETGRLGPLDERFQRWSEEDAEPERLWWRVAIHEPGGHTVPWQEDRDRLSEVRASRPELEFPAQVAPQDRRQV